ncbi:MAG: leucine-rich repeat domain-containing protein [Treponema sp.]|nr:leucine-rich repeat domain-containing protein [Treponema sp.]
MKKFIILSLIALITVFIGSCFPYEDVQVIYNSGSSTSGEPPVDSAVYSYGDSVVVMGKGSLVNPGYTFLGWWYDDEIYEPGDTVTVGYYDIEFTAAWDDGASGNFIFDVSGNEAILTKYTSYYSSHLIIPSTCQGKPVTKIDDDVFFDKSICGVTLPANLKQIGRFAFTNCSIQTLSIPDSVESIGIAAFQNNYISELNIGTGLETITEGVFSDNYITIIVLPDNIKTIKSAAFYKNDIIRIQLGDNVNIESGTSLGTNGAQFKVFYEAHGMQAGRYGFAGDSWVLLQ